MIKTVISSGTVKKSPKTKTENQVKNMVTAQVQKYT